jgi:hypothetical protein
VTGRAAKRHYRPLIFATTFCGDSAFCGHSVAPGLADAEMGALVGEDAMPEFLGSEARATTSSSER